MTSMLLNLPQDLLRYIFLAGHLRLRDVAALSRTCKTLRRLHSSLSYKKMFVDAYALLPIRLEYSALELPTRRCTLTIQSCKYFPNRSVHPHPPAAMRCTMTERQVAQFMHTVTQIMEQPRGRRGQQKIRMEFSCASDMYNMTFKRVKMKMVKDGSPEITKCDMVQLRATLDSSNCMEIFVYIPFIPFAHKMQRQFAVLQQHINLHEHQQRLQQLQQQEQQQLQQQAKHLGPSQPGAGFRDKLLKRLL